MLLRLFPLTLLSLFATALLGQLPQAIQVQPGWKVVDSPESPLACADQFAGTISFSNFLGQSNDIDLDTIYFCEGDQIDVVHNGDADLTGDPNPLTTPGVTYAYFDCPPTITGPDKTTILTEPCIFIANPPPANGFSVTIGGSANGNQTFFNNGLLQANQNGGDPLLVWFAPITIDNFAIKQYENDPVTFENGPCVHVNTAEAFAIVYLNEIQTSGLNTNTGLSGCQGSFQVTGGLPEFDGSDYNISIQLIGNPSVTGTVLNGPTSHNGLVVFKVPAPGFYNVIIEDGKSCGTSFLADMSSCTTVSQNVQSATVAPGDNICLNVTSQNGFLDLVAMQYALTWDPSVLQFTSVTNFTPLLTNFSQASFNSLVDSLVVAWFEPAGNGISLPNNTVLFQACFTVVGTNGECTDVAFVDPEGTPIEVTNENGATLGFNGTAGQVCVSNNALVVNTSQDSVSCSGATDGSFTVTVSGGQSPYQLTWQNTGGGPLQGPFSLNTAPFTFTQNNVAAGTYSVNVTDSQGTPLVTTKQVTVLSPPILNILLNENQPACNGDVGSITSTLVLDSVVVNNPTSLYTYMWSTMATTTFINNITSGTYTLTVTEIATGCTSSTSTFLPQPPTLNVQITLDSATCSGVGDGNISVNVFGGTPDINGDYVIQFPSIGGGGGTTIVGGTANIFGLPSDFYQLIVTDDNGCVFEQNVFLPAIKVLSMNAIITNVNCSNDCSGSIFVAGATDGGVAATPYNFDWFGTPPPPPSIDNPATTNLTQLCVGTYTLVMEDQAGCEIDSTFTISQPPPLDVVLVDLQNESCQPGDDGSIIVAVNGGTFPYTFSWNTPNTDSIATGLSAGLYTVIVEDVFNCFDTLSAMVNAPQPPVITSLPDDVLSCANSTDGTLTVTATAGTAPIISYDWSNADIGSTISNLSTGQYIVTVSDQIGCTAVDTATVTAPLPLTLDSIILTSPQCPGDGGGAIQLLLSGGTTPYFFTWSNGAMGNNQNVLGSIMAGNYSVTVVDANNCQPPLFENIILEDPPSIVATFSNIDSVSCANTGMTCDGTATATALYSDGSTGIFDFTWESTESDNNVQSSTAVQLCQDFQELTISDGICFIVDSVLIPAPLPITPGATVDNVSCNGLSDGETTLTPSGGTAPYTITWPALGQNGPTVTGLPAGNYTAQIFDSKMCSYTHTVTIVEPNPLEVFLNTNGTANVSCPGDEDGIITVEVQGGNINLGDPVFLWSNGVAAPNSNVAQFLPAGTYSVTVVDVKGCEDTLSHSISEPPPIQFRLGEIAPIGCFGDNTFITVDSVWGGNLATYQFSVDMGTNRLPGEPAPVFAGEHFIEVVDAFNGCKADTTINIGQPQPVILSLPAILEIELGDSLTRLQPSIASSVPIDTFIWSPADQLSCSDCKSPYVNAIKSQLYTLTIIDANGCATSAQVLVEIDRNRNVFIPNVFSPNADGINDLFQIFTGIGVSHINFIRLYDRWGEQVYSVDNQSPSPDGVGGWDGEFRGEKMNPGVFLYLIEVEFIDGKVLLYRGDVTLLR